MWLVHGFWSGRIWQICFFVGSQWFRCPGWKGSSLEMMSICWGRSGSVEVMAAYQWDMNETSVFWSSNTSFWMCLASLCCSVWFNVPFLTSYRATTWIYHISYSSIRYSSSIIKSCLTNIYHHHCHHHSSSFNIIHHLSSIFQWFDLSWEPTLRPPHRRGPDSHYGDIERYSATDNDIDMIWHN